MSGESSWGPNSGCFLLLAIAGAILGVLAAVTLNGGDLVQAAFGNDSSSTAPNGQFAVGALPTVGPEGGGTTATTAAPATAAPTVAPTQAPVATQAQQQPAPTNPPQTQPPAQCGFPGSIGVSGANAGSVSGSGGTVTATASSVTASANGLVNCGQHYALTVRVQPSGGGFTSRTECSFGSFSNTASTTPGDTVVITLQLPPNSCG